MPKQPDLEKRFDDKYKPTNNINIQAIDDTVAKFDPGLLKQMEEEGVIGPEEMHWCGGEVDYAPKPDNSSYTKIPDEYKSN
jgi:hypothetical protein